MTYPPELVRCPVHDATDCSPLLNGCDLPARLRAAYDVGHTVAREEIHGPPPEADEHPYARRAKFMLTAERVHALLDLPGTTVVHAIYAVSDPVAICVVITDPALEVVDPNAEAPVLHGGHVVVEDGRVRLTYAEAVRNA